MGSAALKGKVELNYIKLGAYRFFIAPFGTAIDEAAAFDTENPPAPWRDLGLASNDSAMTLKVGMFDLKAGIPSLRKKKWITERDVEMNLVLEEFSPYNLGRAIWQDQVSIKQFKDTPAVEELGVGNELGATQYNVASAASSTVFTLTTAAGLVVGNKILIETNPADLPSSVNSSTITNITGAVVTVSPALPDGTPSASDKLKVLVSLNGRNTGSRVITVTDGTEWTVDQFVALAQIEDDLSTSPYEFRIVSIAGNILTLDRDLGVQFVAAPFIGEILSFKIPFGGGETCKFAIVAVWDDLGGGQLVVFMPHATAKGDINITYNANASNLKYPMSIMGDSYNMNLLDEDTIQSIAASPSPTSTVFTVDDGTVFAEGDMVALEATEALLDNSENKGVIDSIATDAITLVGPLAIAPVAGWKIKRVTDTVGALVAILHRQNSQS